MNALRSKKGKLKLTIAVIALALVIMGCLLLFISSFDLLSPSYMMASDSRYERFYMPSLSPPNDEPYDLTFFESYGTNPFVSTEDETFSTFGMDVDTASYTIGRRWINDGNLPDKDSVRTEEYVNYFEQDYPSPDGDFGIYLEGAESEFGRPNYHLLKIGIKAREVNFRDRKPANMVFLVDVSGSMQREDRLELVIKSLSKLTENLKEEDKIGLAVYAGGAGKILDLTSDKNRILNALSELSAGGSTNIEDGIRIAYQMARDGFEEGKINRIVIASDGVANNGITSAEEILAQIRANLTKE